MEIRRRIRVDEEPRVIFPEVTNDAREVATKWSVDHALLDQLAHEILTRYRYDRPFQQLADLTRRHISILMRPNGSASACFNTIRGAAYGDCVDLCKLVLDDSDFIDWLSQVRIMSGRDLAPYLVHGIAPSHFLDDWCHHYWLTLADGETATMLYIDPAFHRVSDGAGYSYRTPDRSIPHSFLIPDSGVAKLSMPRYSIDKGENISFPDSDRFDTVVLGLGTNWKILCLSFACGKSKLDPIVPLVVTIDNFGQNRCYYSDPNLGIVEINTKIAPARDDDQVFTRMFEMMTNFRFSFLHS